MRNFGRVGPRPLLLALLAGCLAPVASAGDDPSARYRVERHVVEVRGPWKAYVQVRSDLMSRVMRSWSSVVREGPEAGSEPRSVLLGRGRGGLARPDQVPFRLHEEGWLAVAGGEGLTLVPPTGERTSTHGDLELTTSSRFLRSGFLSASVAADPAGELGLDIVWAWLGPDGLSPAVRVARVAGADRASLEEAHIAAFEGASGVDVRWVVPAGETRVHGSARIAPGASLASALPADEAGPRVRVAAVQMASEMGGVEANLVRIEAHVAAAARGGAKFVVLPETAVTGYLSQDLQTNWRVPGRPLAAAFAHGRDPAEHAEPVPGPSVERLAAVAKRWSVWLTVPLLERAGPAEGAHDYFNSVVLLGPNGRLRAHYRKLSPWPHPEQSWATPGDLGLAHVETPFGRVGLAICFDVHTVFARYAEQPGGLWALLYPIAWVGDGDEEAWFGTELPARVEAANFHVVGANWSVDVEQPWHGYGHSTIVSREGRVLAAAKSRIGDEIVYADLPVAAPPGAGR